MLRHDRNPEQLFEELSRKNLPHPGGSPPGCGSCLRVRREVFHPQLALAIHFLSFFCLT